MIYDQHQCDKTDWLFVGLGRSPAVSLFEYGKIKGAAAFKPVRLRVTEKCSLVVEKVTHQHEGLYVCRQFDGSEQIGGDAHVDLSVVSNSEHQNTDEVTLSCSVQRYGSCRHTVKWLKTNTQSQSDCSATVTFTTSQLQTLSDSLTCEVTDDDGRKQTFPFRRSATATEPTPSEPSDVVSSTSATKPPPPTTTTPTTEPPPPEPSDVVSSTSRRDPTKPQGDTTGTKASAETTSTDPDPHTGFPHVLRSIMVSVALAALIISVVTVNMWTRTKGNKKQMEEICVCDDDEVNYENDGVSSASV
ncbi:mucin-2-like [Betta splendens]|uniref:Mucin-2-like n=1 Tax=Betta splendens TaxID=158456 RepID=A0A9W2XLR7_BETSP|nr:mucin-2-like [Betta splendens]